MSGESLGYAMQFAVDSALPFDTSSIWMEVKSETISKQGQILETDGIRGTRSHIVERTRTGPYSVSGQVTLAVDRVTLDTLLPYILGGSESTNVFSVAETIGEFVMMIDRGAKVFTYAGCRIGRATFRGSSSAPVLELVLDIEAETETVGNSGTFPSGMTEITTKPYIFHEGVLTLQSSAREFSSFELVIDNGLIADRWMNSLTRAEILASDRIVTLGTDHPYSTSNTDLYGQALAGAGATLVFTNAESSGDVLTFTMGAIQYPDKSPNVTAKTETTLPLEGTCRKSGSTDEIEITNAHS